MEQTWIDITRKSTVCVDSYENGVLQGRLYNPFRDAESFSSLSRFLIKMEQLLDEQNLPQAYTLPKKFSSVLQPQNDAQTHGVIRRGAKATFELQVLFRQNTSWQGVLLWREQNVEHSFRSVLELVLLMDSALRSLDGTGAA